MDNSSSIRALSPRPIWNHFADLNAVPRASKKEEQAVAFVQAFGMALGLETIVDQAGNVIIRKPASPGREHYPVVILQGHLDMVHQKNADTHFDFDKEGIQSYIDGDWVKARGTTLGADNGIGVAAILSVLESTTLIHPPIEALFTVDEETGMSGAQNLQEGLLKGKILLNLDSEEEDELTIGCAGGLDTFSEYAYTEVEAPSQHKAFELKVSGLKGGHSGIDIHLGRANANKILIRLLHDVSPAYGVHLCSFLGGNLRNAIPREATAIVVVSREAESAYLGDFSKRRAAILQEYTDIEPGMKLDIAPCTTPKGAMDSTTQDRVLKCLYAIPNGVYRMSPSIPGLVETSNNLAKVEIGHGVFASQSLQRSATESGIQDISYAVRAPLELLGANVAQSGGYPGWAPDAHSALLKLMTALYTELYTAAPKVAACHAGLECGIIGKHYPGMDMISFGPTIRHPHSPDEKVHIPSVEKFWNYLTAILSRIA